MYNKIINPLNKESYNIVSKEGKLLLKNYINNYKLLLGGFNHSRSRHSKPRVMGPKKHLKDSRPNKSDYRIKRAQRKFLDKPYFINLRNRILKVEEKNAEWDNISFELINILPDREVTDSDLKLFKDIDEIPIKAEDLTSTSRKSRKTRKSRKSRNQAPKVSLLRLLLLVLILITTFGKSEANRSLNKKAAQQINNYLIKHPDNFGDELVHRIGLLDAGLSISDPDVVQTFFNGAACSMDKDPLPCFAQNVLPGAIQQYERLEPVLKKRERNRAIIRKFKEEADTEGSLAYMLRELMEEKEEENKGFNVKKGVKAATLAWSIYNAVKAFGAPYGITLP